MNKIIMVAVVFSLVTAFSAKEAGADDYLCVAIGGLSKDIMRARQAGVEMAKVMAIADSLGSKDYTEEESLAVKELSTMLKRLTISAYSMPRMLTDDGKERAISDFSNDASLGCFSNLMEDLK